jgi:hypothetical protein
MRGNFAQRLPHTISSNASANRKYLCSEGEDFVAYVFCREPFAEMSPQNVGRAYARLHFGLASKIGHHRGIAQGARLSVSQFDIEASLGE